MNIIEDKNYLKTTDDIESYFKEDGYEYFECGQGYSQDRATVTVKIDQLYYKVEMEAEIGSAKQDHGDRLYWVEYISKVTYEEISETSIMFDEKLRLEAVAIRATAALDKARKELRAHYLKIDDLPL